MNWFQGANTGRSTPDYVFDFLIYQEVTKPREEPEAWEPPDYYFNKPAPARVPPKVSVPEPPKKIKRVTAKVSKVKNPLTLEDISDEEVQAYREEDRKLLRKERWNYVRFTVFFLLYTAFCYYAYSIEREIWAFAAPCLLAIGFLVLWPGKSLKDTDDTAIKEILLARRRRAEEAETEDPPAPGTKQKRRFSFDNVVAAVIMAIMLFFYPTVIVGLHWYDLYQERKTEQALQQSTAYESTTATAGTTVGTTTAGTTYEVTAADGTTRSYYVPSQSAKEDYYGVHNYVDAADFADEMAAEEFDGDWEEAYDYYEENVE